MFLVEGEECSRNLPGKPVPMSSPTEWPCADPVPSPLLLPPGNEPLHENCYLQALENEKKHQEQKQKSEEQQIENEKTFLFHCKYGKEFCSPKPKCGLTTTDKFSEPSKYERTKPSSSRATPYAAAAAANKACSSSMQQQHAAAMAAAESQHQAYIYIHMYICLHAAHMW